MTQAAILSRPYPFEISAKKRWGEAVVFSAFVFLFLYVFQPFQIGNLKEHTLTVSLGYGLVCLIIMILLNIVIPKLNPAFFDESRWTTGQQILWTFVNVFLIGMGNFFYSAILNIVSFSFQSVIIFQFFTVAVGAFPIVFSILFNQSRLQVKYDKKSARINASLSKQNADKITTVTTQEEIVTIPSQYAQEDLIIQLEQLLFIRSADNYVEVFHLRNNQIQKTFLRNSLKAIEDLAQHKHLFRCHKSYIVNLQNVNHVSGNAQGYKLHLKNCEETVPVSRSKNHFLKEYFE